MRLVYTATSYPPALGGAQLLHHRLAVEFSRRHSVQVVTHWKTNRSDWLLGTSLLAPSRSDDYLVDGIPVHQLGFGRIEKLALLPAIAAYYPLMRLAVQPLAARLRRKLGPFTRDSDLVHNVRIGREPISVASLQAARDRGVPFVFTPVHHPRWIGWRYRVYLDLYRSADALIALTMAEEQTLARLGVEERRIHVVGMGPDLAARANPAGFRERHGVTGPMVLFLGQHYPYKGYRQVLDAARSVWAKVPEACFVFVGPPVGRSESWFESLEDPRIHRLGALPLQEKTDALAACDLLCVPSTQESFGVVYVEAWSFSKPVVGCPIPAVAEVISHGEDGLLVDQEPAVIADAICELLLNPTTAQQMGEAGRRKALGHYSWEKIAARTEQAYYQVLGSTPPPSTPSARL